MNTSISFRRQLTRLLAHLGGLVCARPTEPPTGLAPMRPVASARSLGSPKPQVSVPPARAGATAVRDPAKTMRSMDEMRADLARLRANSTQRHAPVPIKRQTTFDATVFANFTEAATTANADPQAEYAQTVYLPLAASKSQSKR